SNLSGIAIKLMFMDAVLKAYDHQILYGEMLDRRLKVMQAILGKMNLAQEKLFKDMSVSVKFTSVLPDNIQETITNLITAAGGDAIMSQETAVKRNPYVDSPETEIELLDAQREASNNMGGTFNV
ncbi:MAG: phage portal protein, partial [Smithella sp.]|nr:phage portal protein [Smithella sp.]